MKYKLLVLSAVIANQVLATQVHAEDNQIQGGAVLTVGNDGACGFSTIQTAVDSANGGSVIRIASNKLYVESVGVIDKSLTLQGGYADCSAANANITDQSQAVVGGVGNHAIQVSSPGLRRDVTLRNLAFGGANVGITTGGNIDLIAENVLVSNNDMGVFIFNGDQNINFDDVNVSENNGVGIVCSGGDNVMSINGNSLISDNTASNDGGGMIVNTGCRANVYAPTQITGNTANGHGGGVAVINGAIANLNGIEISNNTADFDGDNDGSGGAVYVADEFSMVNAVNVQFEGNYADKGGAVAVDEGRFTSYAANSISNPCSKLGECTSFTGNGVSSFGGVFYATNSGYILAMHALIRGNGAPSSGLVGHTNSGGHIEIEGSVIAKNGGEDLPADDLFHIAGLLDNTTRITLDHVTIADNELTGSVIRNSFGNFSLKSSIVQEEVSVSSETNSVSHAFECLIVHETDSFSAGGTVTIDDPLFIGSGNYHIKPSSPAIDYCYAAATLTVELGYDTDLEGRNYDDPNVDDLHGTYDIGADEYRWDNDLIFMNGFEEVL